MLRHCLVAIYVIVIVVELWCHSSLCPSYGLIYIHNDDDDGLEFSILIRGPGRTDRTDRTALPRAGRPPHKAERPRQKRWNGRQERWNGRQAVKDVNILKMALLLL